MAFDVVPIIVDNTAPAYVQHFATDVNDALVRLSVIDEDITSALESDIDALQAILSNVVASSYTANADLTATIPVDDSIPQSGEGTEILNVTITPSSNTSKVMLRGHGWGATSAAVNAIWAVFSSQSADAVQAGLFIPNSVTSLSGYCFNILHAPATTSAVTYSVRVGPASNTLRLNGTTAARLLGGSSSAYLVAEEIPV